MAKLAATAISALTPNSTRTGGHRKQGDHRAVTGCAGVCDAFAEEAANIVVAADALAGDEHLRRCRNPMLRLEGVGFLARAEVMILDLVTAAPQQVLGLEPVRADVAGHHHPMKNGDGWRFGTIGHVSHLGLLESVSRPI